MYDKNALVYQLSTSPEKITQKIKENIFVGPTFSSFHEEITEDFLRTKNDFAGNTTDDVFIITPIRYGKKATKQSGYVMMQGNLTSTSDGCKVVLHFRNTKFIEILPAIITIIAFIFSVIAGYDFVYDLLYHHYIQAKHAISFLAGIVALLYSPFIKIFPQHEVAQLTNFFETLFAENVIEKQTSPIDLHYVNFEDASKVAITREFRLRKVMFFLTSVLISAIAAFFLRVHFGDPFDMEFEIAVAFIFLKAIILVSIQMYGLYRFVQPVK